MYRTEESPETKVTTIWQPANVEYRGKAETIEEACKKSKALAETLSQLKKKGFIENFYHSVIVSDLHQWKKVEGVGVDYESATQTVTCTVETDVKLNVEYEAWRGEPTDSDIESASNTQIAETLWVDGWDLEEL